MNYQIEVLSTLAGKMQRRDTCTPLLLGLYSRTMARIEFDAGATVVWVEIFEVPENDRRKRIYSGTFHRENQLALARSFDLQDKQGRDCPQG